MNRNQLQHRKAWDMAVGLGILSLAIGGCKINPATGRQQFDFLSQAEEIRIGSEAAPELTEGYGGPVPDLKVTNYVHGVGDTLARQVEDEYQDLPWEFTLLNSDVINAFALPGGKVFVSRALVERFDNEAQLAGVLGHEIGHVTAEHADRAMQRQFVLAGLAVGAGMAAGSDESARVAVGALVTGAGVFALRYDRNQESQADHLGMRYMSRAGYDPRGMLQVMHVLQAASQSGKQPEWLSTHPLPSTRIDQIEDRLNRDHYQRAMNDGHHGFYQSRFRANCLDRLERLPPAPQVLRDVEFDLAHTDSWCAICAANAVADDAGS